MIVLEQYKTVLLKLRNPNRVTSVIPAAQIIEQDDEGNYTVAVHHDIDEVRVLRNLGIRIPSPILYYYNFEGRFIPYKHQKMTSAFLTMHTRALVLNEIGTGKTQSALWAADYLMTQKIIKKVLIISPLSTLERVWGDSIFFGFIHRKAVTLHGSAAKRMKLLKADADFYIINHDGFSIIADDVKGMFDLVIVDEAAVLRNPQTTRFKLFRKWMRENSTIRLWLMTGTPTPNEPTDAWALSVLVNNPYRTKTLGMFKDQTMFKVAQWKWMPKPEAMDIVEKVLQPAVRYTRDDCLDLPDTVFQTRKVSLTKEQAEHYATMLRHLLTEVKDGGGTISAANEAVKMQKLIQIVCGVAYDALGNNVYMDCRPRVNAVKEIIDEVGGKVIVFVPLTGTLNMLSKELSKHWQVGVVDGSVSSTRRNVIFRDFQETEQPHVLIAHPATMAHGLTLTAASTVIWYGPINSNEQYVQANGRIERIGKHHTSNVVHIEATELESRMFGRLRNKQKLQGLLLDLIKEKTEE